MVWLILDDKHQKMSKKSLRRRFNCLRTLTSLCGAYTRCARRCLCHYQERKGLAVGIMHSSCLEEAKRFMDLGMMISFSEWWRLRKPQMSKKPQLACRSIKIHWDRCPLSLAPVPKRGRENKTAYTRYVVIIAELRGLTMKKWLRQNLWQCKKRLGLDWERKNTRSDVGGTIRSILKPYYYEWLHEYYQDFDQTINHLRM